MTDPPIRHALPQRQPDVDEASYHGIDALRPKSAESPFSTNAAFGANGRLLETVPTF